MLNLKQLEERYSKYPNTIGHLGWGSRKFYEVNSDKVCLLNRTYGSFILNEENQVEEFNMEDGPVERLYFLDEEWDYPTKEVTEFFYDLEGSNKWWGKTLDQYYPHPWYPEKEIEGFEIVRDLPLFSVGEVIDLDVDDTVRSNEDFEIAYYKHQCLAFPEFFKPIYKN